MFSVTRIYSDTSGDSHFGDMHVSLREAGIIGNLSDPIDVKSLVFREVTPTYDWDFHTAPARQYIILLDGEIQIETSLGEVRNFKGGDILFVEDTTGKGHRTKNLIEAKRKSLFITVD
jgi:hypothetical protein